MKKNTLQRLSKPFVITALILTYPFSFAHAEEASTIGHYIFGMHRINWSKMGVDNVSHNVEDNTKSAKAFYPELVKHQIYNFKNIARMDKDAIGYGDWDKDYRQIMGVEYDYKRNRGSSSGYDYRDRSGSLYLLGDKAFFNKFWRFGGGAVLTKFDSDYTNSLASFKEDSAIGEVYAIYNDKENQIRLRSRAYAGYGSSSEKRKTLSANYEDDFDTYYYGTANSLAKTFSHNIFFLQGNIELNGYGVNRGKINENGGMSLKSNDSFLWENVIEAFVGIKQNGYSLRVGPSLTTNLTDAYDPFYATYANGNNLYFSPKKDERDYITWKAYFTYDFDNGMGIYSDVRYHNKDEENMTMAIGVNYSF